ncbi:MAG: hypothetical protein ACI8P3_001790 [Saprospiraceae bacterium]|jgi:hypothetical protein
MVKILAVILASFFIITQAESQIVWNSTLDVASPSLGNNHPRIVKNDVGNPLVIWGKSNNVMFSRWNGIGFTAPIVLNPDTISIAEASWMGPDIAAHGDTVYVVFKQTPEDSYSSHIWCIHSYDGGFSFSSPIQVDNIADNISRFPTVTTDTLGNPIVGFMKFDPSFGNPRWVVSRSIDFGSSFSIDALASGWSNSTSKVCDCCPGAITSLDNTVAMLYRDNDNNIRDSWAGISNDLGNTFNGGMNIDQQNWTIFACPASGPDGVILGDTLYSTYMSGASGMARVYFNKSSLSEMTGSAGNLLTENIPDLGQQNFPRIANSGKAVAIAWKQVVNGDSQLPVLFTENITAGFSPTYEIIALSNVNNTDLILTSENIFIVWQDDNSGTVKFQSGTYSTPSLIQEKILINDLTAYPNPSAEAWTIEGYAVYPKIKIELFDFQGILFYSNFIEKNTEFFIHKIDNSNLISGLYVLRFSHKNFQHSIKLLKK